MGFCNENRKPILTNFKQFSRNMLNYKEKRSEQAIKALLSQLTLRVNITIKT